MIPPIFLAVLDKNIKQARYLLNNGTSAQTRDLSGDFVIHFAAQIGQIDMVQLLIKFGANVNKQDGDLNKFLHLAAQLVDATLVQLLLDNDANPSTENAHGQTPLTAATFFNHYKVAKNLLRGGTFVLENCFYSYCYA